MQLSDHTATSTWLQLISAIISHGVTTYPRGYKCLEVMGVQTKFPMHKPIVTVPYRRLGYRFMFAEAAWILSGDNRVETIAPFSKAISSFSDNGQTFFGAYGPKISAQLPWLIEKLSKDTDSRQAVINIWREKPPETKDVPCTLSVQFLIRDSYLHCIDTMRSSDAWLGWPYDVFNFSMLSCYIILAMRHVMPLKLGNLTMNLGSSHLYTYNQIDAERCLDYEVVMKNPRKFRYAVLDPLIEWVQPEDLVNHLWAVAKMQPDKLQSKWCHCIAGGVHDNQDVEQEK